MSQTRRLGQLYAAESWLNSYRYLVNSNFKAYDFDSLRTALINHVQTNYPEDFNDFINSSEYVALIDLISYLGQNLAFRSDLNLRETFLETAEVRGNVLNIARQLGYKAYRNGAAAGFLRVTAVNSTQNIYDSKGVNLAGQTIVWGDPINPDFNEQFSVILNEVLSRANPVGRPMSSITTQGTVRQLYQIAEPDNRTMVQSFNLTARNNTTYSCEIVPVFINNQTKSAVESDPNPYGYQTMLFNNDGTGYSSPNNGWFFMFKQGVLKFEDYVLSTKVENRVIDIQGENINETDVWVQSIDGDGKVLTEWEQVPSTVGKNIAFNAIGKDTRKVYEVITRANDTISIKFGDDVYSDIPTGNIRIWYRESANEDLTFTPMDVAGKEFAIRYVDSQGLEQDAIFTVQLSSSVSSSSGETLEQIKNRASRTAASQDRMITANDYNLYPEGKVAGVDKIKAINRTYAGQSLYADIQDPTGTYRPVISLAGDGFLYTSEVTEEKTLSMSQNNNEVLTWFQDLILTRGLHQLYYNAYNAESQRVEALPDEELTWHKVDYLNGNTHGYFHLRTDPDKVPVRLGKGSVVLANRVLRKNSLVNVGTQGWTRILDVYREGFGVADNNGDNTGLRANGQGAVFLSGLIEDNTGAEYWMPSLRTLFTDNEKVEIVKEIEKQSNFGLRYDHKKDRWIVVKQNEINISGGLDLTTAGTSNDSSWLIRFAYNNGVWAVVVRKDQTIFGSVSELIFHNQRFGSALDQTTRRVIKDSVKFLKVNEGLSKDIELDVVDYVRLDDGRYDPKRVIVLLPGLVDNLVPNDPTLIKSVIGNSNILLARKEFLDAQGQFTLAPAIDGTMVVTGRSALTVQFNHVPLRDNRVDPTTTNIIDMFVLTTVYNTAFRNWIASGAKEDQRPIPLTSYSLTKLMEPIAPYKSVSDSIIYHPVTYKVLFGEGSDNRNKVKIRVTKSDGTRISDAEIKSRVITAINNYFDVGLWDFGETFYFTDMASWVHQNVGGIISSIALIPRQTNLTSNDMFQIKCDEDEIFISSATVADVEVITGQVAPTK
jgi:hypothetical protein